MPVATAAQFVSAPPEIVYRAFTNATAMTGWLCDIATVSPRPGGRLYFYWNAGFYVAGEFIALDPERSLSFKWCGRDEPGATTVNVTFERQNGGTQVSLTHEVPDGAQWSGLAEGFQEEWAVSLGNLAYLLETGKDLRIVNRPMLGIIPGDFNSDQANRLRVPTNSGMRIDSAVEGLSAANAGLQHDDVIVSLGGKPITGSPESLPAALTGKRGGDRVEVVFYRGGEKRTVTMELSRRQMPQVPLDRIELGKIARQKYGDAIKALLEAFKNISEEQTAVKPNPREWSAREVVAHLIHNEREIHAYIGDLIGGHVRWADDWGGNVNARIQATIIAYGSTAAMLEELKRLSRETIALIENLPPEFEANKNSFFAVGMQIAGGDPHIADHLDQIRDALAAAKTHG